MTPAGRLGVGGSAPWRLPNASKLWMLSCVSRARAANFERALRVFERRAGEVPMTGVWALAALWLGLALIASLLSVWLRISTALSEIAVGTFAQLIIGSAFGS